MVRIFYKDFEEDSLPLESSFTFEEDGDNISAAFEGELIRVSDGYLLRGGVDFTLNCVCDRCGGEAHIDMSDELMLSIRPAISAAAGEEYEMTDEDGEEYVTDPEFLDLDDVLRQEILLQLPVKKLCSEACNVDEYMPDEDTEAESGLSALKKLLK
jgi:uncharacterized protein